MTRSVLLILFVVLWSLEAFAQSNSVTGTVMDLDTGTPLANVEVFAYQPGAPVLYQVLSDAQGRYRLVGMPVGKVSIECHREGFESVSPPIVVDLRGGRTLQVDREMVPLGYNTEVLLPLPSPAIDVGSSGTATNLGGAFRRLVPLFSR
ncbi:carboxypeptidase regulatory-like domain-containing protein [Aggregicoccus sp. 17bor-14]|uniref:carboxypeptidase-like regulatory domain-containing protein n=1 Tax=Myxococcaceae TaxID=31 RepID=UPI00129D135E|nr:MULTISPECIES: carboxypeptidase-like regulatory domain-containing protein [Myxococcaceae]MBF5044541.1 carboxypeptidase regulatory-like domain-containing protein [Simulacricoccus sp. 17bor-14]MRI90286.1 carboxypeptidase regulatory-like domain-containing protein [Aggregicoccus sp. 17bor-14]